jgi:2,4-dienoyl-CoA reductase (NADPH2)
MKRVRMVGGVNYERITPDGIWLSHGEAREAPELLAVDAVVLCAGQEPERSLSAELDRRRIAHHRIGGADVAAELDAKRAIDQAARLAARL